MAKVELVFVLDTKHVTDPRVQYAINALGIRLNEIGADWQYVERDAAPVADPITIVLHDDRYGLVIWSDDTAHVSALHADNQNVMDALKEHQIDVERLTLR